MVSTRRGSCGGKRSPSTPENVASKRSKTETASDEASVRLDDLGNSKELASSPFLDDHPQAGLANDPSKDVAMSEQTDHSKPTDATSKGDDADKVPVISPTSELEKPKDSSVAWSRLRKQALNSTTVTNPWGKLLSQYSQNPHVPLCGPIFTIGRSRTCNLSLKDSSVSSVLCKLKHTQFLKLGLVVLERIKQCNDTAVTLLESVGNTGSVQVNGKTVKKNINISLKGGDELVFSSSGNYAYVSSCYTE